MADPVEIKQVGQPPKLQPSWLPVVEAGKELAREAVRAGLAIAFTIILGVTLLGSFQKIGTSGWTQTKEFLSIVLPAETALLGAAVAFFFATESKK
jgi:uncharacterized PurR-regulated membrane protein YhhQ (DUF165 family)